MKQRLLITGLLITILIIGMCSAINYYSKKKTPAIKTLKIVNTPPPLQHLAVIMDGNRRWAKKRGLETRYGHQAGIKPLRETIEFCIEHNIPYLSAYAFSLENFKRSKKELHYLFHVIARQLLEEETDSLVENGVQVRFVGDHSLFPEHLLEDIATIETKTAKGSNLTFCILFCYGGRREIIHAIKSLLHEHAKKDLSPNDLTEDTLKRYMWTADIPDPDLIIRTGKRKRLSNFLTYQSAYSELYFTDTYWPDITKNELKKALAQFQNTERSFGA